MVETEGRNSQKYSLQESDFCELAEYTKKLGLQGRLCSYSVMSAMCWERNGQDYTLCRRVRIREGECGGDKHTRLTKSLQFYRSGKSDPVESGRTSKVVSGEKGREAVEPQRPPHLTRTNSSMSVHWTLDHLHV